VELFNRGWGGITTASFGIGSKGGYTGFRDELVNWGQKSGVYKHISASIGTSILENGYGFVFAQTFLSDFPKFLSGNPEGLAEMYGNLTGASLLPTFNQYFTPLVGGDTERLRNILKDTLCVK
jgi:hypothetical protein